MRIVSCGGVGRRSGFMQERTFCGSKLGSPALWPDAWAGQKQMSDFISNILCQLKENHFIVGLSFRYGGETRGMKELTHMVLSLFPAGSVPDIPEVLHIHRTRMNASPRFPTVAGRRHVPAVVFLPPSPYLGLTAPPLLQTIHSPPCFHMREPRLIVAGVEGASVPLCLAAYW
ncbi:hypothetical protein E2C01_052042 [Portunus trituberculatus]|uniref:Uncharacterized protein n=1 Tax=Portunus trituberculatus TaxID=210409 RepID=A0A5B7GKE1_PORTR|nr:hypothetical protein [Portunus trituberculatus]